MTVVAVLAGWLVASVLAGVVLGRVLRHAAADPVCGCGVGLTCPPPTAQHTP